MSAPITVAVLGTGSIGLRHLRALGRLPGVQAVAVPVRSSRLAELAAEGWSVAGDLRSACQGGATKAVIATDTLRHESDAREALRLGLDVLVEKPLAVDAEAARRIRAAARDAGRAAFVACVLRHAASLRAFRDLLGRLGPLHEVRAQCQSYLPDWRPGRPYRESYSASATQGGVLRDLIHEIDYTGWIFGWPDRVQAMVRSTGRLDIEAEDQAALWWECPGGPAVSVALDYLTRPTRRVLCARGVEGTLEWDGVAHEVCLQRRDGSVERSRRAEAGDDIYDRQMAAFVNARTGVHDPALASLDDGVRALAVCDAARRAAARRAEEPVHGLEAASDGRGGRGA